VPKSRKGYDRKMAELLLDASMYLNLCDMKKCLKKQLLRLYQVRSRINRAIKLIYSREEILWVRKREKDIRKRR
jgi:hypothetical protein